MQYSSTPQDGLVLCEGDPNEWSVGITKVTYERLMREEDGMDLCSLWMFFAYTCRWQKTNQARASISYVCKGTHWGEAKVQRLKNRLVELGLIQNVQKRDEEGKVSGWYVKVLHLAKAASRSSESEDVDQILGFAGSCEIEVQILKNSKVKCSRTNTPLAPEGEWGEDSQDLEVPSPSTTTAPEPSPPVARSPLPWVPNDEQKRINRWFKRRDSTRWSDAEIRAYRKLPDTSEEEWDLLEEYKLNCPFARKDVATMLNRWAGEIDRARDWDEQSSPSSSSNNGYSPMLEHNGYRSTLSP